MKKLNIIAFSTFVAIFMIANVDAADSWIKISEDGFIGENTAIFEFDSNLFVNTNEKLYQLQQDQCLQYNQKIIPAANHRTYRQVGDNLYMIGDTNLWFVRKGEAFTDTNWKKVTSTGLPSDLINTIPEIIFNGKIYAGVRTTSSNTFDIYRSSDIDKSEMTWTKIVSDGFGDPQNHQLGYLGIYNNKLIAVTTETRGPIFGNQNAFGSGIEVWESSSGDMNSWHQINKDGFGTELTISGLTFRTNQDFGAAEVYNGYLFIGTQAHYGGEVWRYDGTGLNGWNDVTPSWMGVGPLTPPSRATSMVIYQNLLYMSEGIATPGIDTYDGSTWNTVFSPPPTDALEHLTIVGDKIFVVRNCFGSGTCSEPYILEYPLDQEPLTCKILANASIDITPQLAANELTISNQHSITAKVTSENSPIPGLDVTINIISGPNAGNSATAITNSNGEVTYTYTSSQNLNGLGTDIIEACFVGPNGDKVCNNASKYWVDTTLPTVSCLETVNPSGKKIPTSVNEDGFYELIAKDTLDPNPKIYVVDTGSGKEFGPYVSGTKIKYTQAKTAVPEAKPMGGPKSAINLHIIGNGDANVKAEDFSGNEASMYCPVPPK